MSDYFVYGKNVYYEERVKSTAGKFRNYVVRVGDVSWKKDGDYTPAAYVLVDYNGAIDKTVNPHYLVEPDAEGQSDFSRVLDALRRAKKYIDNM